MYSNLSNQTKFRLNEINNIKDYLNAEMQEIQEECRYISALIQTLIVSSATRAEISFFFYKYYWCCRRNSKCKSQFNIFLATDIKKKLLKITRNKKKKHYKIAMLTKSKLNSIEKLIPQELIDLKISHEEHKSIINEEEKYKKILNFKYLNIITRLKKIL